VEAQAAHAHSLPGPAPAHGCPHTAQQRSSGPHGLRLRYAAGLPDAGASSLPHRPPHCSPPGLRFRASLREFGESDISECSLFCDDMRRLGATRVAVDPSVRVSYLAWTKARPGAHKGGHGTGTRVLAFRTQGPSALRC
jgi:hypothetical protein